MKSSNKSFFDKCEIMSILYCILAGDKLNNVPQLVFLTDASMTSDLGRTGLDESGMEDNSTSSAAHLIILNRYKLERFLRNTTF